MPAYDIRVVQTKETIFRSLDARSPEEAEVIVTAMIEEDDEDGEFVSRVIEDVEVLPAEFEEAA